jgi:hypothetical protein
MHLGMRPIDAVDIYQASKLIVLNQPHRFQTGLSGATDDQMIM